MKRAHSQVCREIADLIEMARRETGPGEIVPTVLCAPRTMFERWLLLLAPPKRKVRPRDPRKAERQTTTKELDALARAVVLGRDANTCEHCRATGTDWAHVYTRRYRWMRWVPDNGLALCRNCHMNFWHQRPLDAAQWFEEKYPERAKRLRTMAAKPQRSAPGMARLALLAEAKNLGLDV